LEIRRDNMPLRPLIGEGGVYDMVCVEKVLSHMLHE
jgi:actin-like protein 6A